MENLLYVYFFYKELKFRILAKVFPVNPFSAIDRHDTVVTSNSCELRTQ